MASLEREDGGWCPRLHRGDARGYWLVAVHGWRSALGVRQRPGRNPILTLPLPLSLYLRVLAPAPLGAWPAPSVGCAGMGRPTALQSAESLKPQFFLPERLWELAPSAGARRCAMVPLSPAGGRIIPSQGWLGKWPANSSWKWAVQAGLENGSPVCTDRRCREGHRCRFLPAAEWGTMAPFALVALSHERPFFPVQAAAL